MSSEESNKMSKKTPSQDSNSEEIVWDIEELKKSIRDAAEDYDKLVGG
jgi:methyl-accepting chemotaxis protein